MVALVQSHIIISSFATFNGWNVIDNPSRQHVGSNFPVLIGQDDVKVFKDLVLTGPIGVGGGVVVKRVAVDNLTSTTVIAVNFQRIAQRCDE